MSKNACAQLWRLTLDGELRNDYTGFCASVADTAGERIWVARHPSGLTSIFQVPYLQNSRGLLNV